MHWLITILLAIVGLMLFTRVHHRRISGEADTLAATFRRWARGAPPPNVLLALLRFAILVGCLGPFIPTAGWLAIALTPAGHRSLACFLSAGVMLIAAGLSWVAQSLSAIDFSYAQVRPTNRATIFAAVIVAFPLIVAGCAVALAVANDL
jgi:hypothetical protein